MKANETQNFSDTIPGASRGLSAAERALIEPVYLAWAQYVQARWTPATTRSFLKDLAGQKPELVERAVRNLARRPRENYPPKAVDIMLEIRLLGYGRRAGATDEEIEEAVLALCARQTAISSQMVVDECKAQRRRSAVPGRPKEDAPVPELTPEEHERRMKLIIGGRPEIANLLGRDMEGNRRESA